MLPRLHGLSRHASRLFEEINEIKNGTFVEDDEMDWDEEYAEEYDVDVEEVIEEAKAFEEDEDDSEIEIELIIADDETESLKAQEFDINID